MKNKQKFDDDYLENDDDDVEVDEEIDEHEYEISSAGKRTINWRRIELMKEQMWLKQQLQDFEDWRDEPA